MQLSVIKHISNVVQPAAPSTFRTPFIAFSPPLCPLSTDSLGPSHLPREHSSPAVPWLRRVPSPPRPPAVERGLLRASIAGPFLLPSQSPERHRRMFPGRASGPPWPHPPELVLEMKPDLPSFGIRFHPSQANALPFPFLPLPFHCPQFYSSCSEFFSLIFLICLPSCLFMLAPSGPSPCSLCLS